MAGRLTHPAGRSASTRGGRFGFVVAGVLLLLAALVYGFLWVLSGLSIVSCTVRGGSSRCNQLGDMWPLVALALVLSVFAGFALLTASAADASGTRRRATAGFAVVAAALLITVGIGYFPLAA